MEHLLYISSVKTEKVIIDFNPSNANTRDNIDTFYALRRVKGNISVIHSLNSHSAQFVLTESVTAYDKAWSGGMTCKGAN